ncbi:mixed lineage kinase domain-like protein isoform X2 [Ascaphus truei]|uniref:mixed lineage kinase domain-like protein isoform X2 n=1 Tax=Ascaphus truei TaxID=8439 RepID=UPI003F5AB806
MWVRLFLLLRTAPLPFLPLVSFQSDSCLLLNMDVLKSLFTISQTIYSLCCQAKYNKKKCNRLQTKIESMMELIEQLKTQPQMFAELEQVVKKLEKTLNDAVSWVTKYSNLGRGRMTIQANSISEEFNHIIERLCDAHQILSLQLHVKNSRQLQNVFDEITRKKENQKDCEEDMELKEFLQDHLKLVADKVDSVADKVDDVAVKVDRLVVAVKTSTPTAGREIKDQRSLSNDTSWESITEIQATDLTRGDLLLQRPNHDLYRGEYHQGPVAIKVFKGSLLRDADLVRKTFQSEIKTLKTFECPNILRLFGICIDNSGSNPCYSMVMELCEKGTLRQLLNREKDLSWELRFRMTMCVATALYRLHQTKLKAILHGSLSSSTFLVDGTYCVKLAGFELSKTETSMGRSSNVKKRQESSDWAYIAPETLGDINAYNKRSEIYSLGIVFWEIASGITPLQGQSLSELKPDDIYKRVCVEVDAGLPADCPPILSDLIKRSRAVDPTERPSAGVILDLLKSL